MLGSWIQRKGQLDCSKPIQHELGLNNTVHVMVSIYSPSFQCLLGLCYDYSFGRDCVSPLSSARYNNATDMFEVPTVLSLVYPNDIVIMSSVNSGGTVVLVSQDGIQRPPLHFPKGGHLLQFLTCLETGLLPHGQLDPPLWNQRGKVSINRQ